MILHEFITSVSIFWFTEAKKVKSKSFRSLRIVRLNCKCTRCTLDVSILKNDLIKKKTIVSEEHIQCSMEKKWQEMPQIIGKRDDLNRQNYE